MKLYILLMFMCASVSLSQSGSSIKTKGNYDDMSLHEDERNFYSANNGELKKPISTLIERPSYWDMTKAELEKPLKFVQNILGLNSKDDEALPSAESTTAASVTPIAQVVPIKSKPRNTTQEPITDDENTEIITEIDKDTTTVKSIFWK